MIKNISEQARKLIKDQQSEWELAGKNYAGLKSVRTKTLAFDGFDMLVQFNPERIISSAAKVDAKSIEARPCFLCRENLPKQQRGIQVLDKYLVLVNPFPIFPEHLTIPHLEHTDQAIEGKFADMLDISRMLEDFTVFYNGPKCGASAPDHFHFQAGIKRFMPIERDYRKGTFFHSAKIINEIEIIKWTDYLRTLITFSGRDSDRLNMEFERLFSALKALNPNESEPMLNILCSYYSGRWHVHIFPRKLHRPWQYFEEGEKQILLSPASVDMGGVLVTPREEDFNKLTMDDAHDIFNQVCLDEESFLHVLSKLNYL
jgi:ATP adenylyltransferase/5',5'''-P-1,P-4-tetraphosphate phosphorylase II